MSGGNPFVQAFALWSAGQPDRAAAIYRAIVQAEPGNALAHTYLGQMLLAQGQYAEGWREHEWRPQRQVPWPLWDGRPLNGAGIFLHGEQGFGDNFQFVRYAPLVAARGGKVVVATRHGIRDLMGSVEGVAQVIEPGEGVNDISWQVPFLSLPLVFGTTESTLPARVPYLHPDPARVAAWRDRLAGLPGRKVGLVWAGNPEFPGEADRSPGLAAMAPLLSVPGVTPVILQMGAGRQALDGFALPKGVVDLGAELTSFGETAAAMMSLDLIISSCTAPLHLAGALGRPVWAILSFAPDWRWLRDRSDSPWYPTMRLFRQPAPGDWADPVARLCAALAADRPTA